MTYQKRSFLIISVAGISVEATPVRRCGHDSCGHNFCGAAPRPTPKFFSAFGDTDGEFFAQIFSWGGRGGGAVFFISKNLPLKGKFFEMVSRALPPGGVWGAWPPQESPLITRALPPQRPCLAPVPCPQFFFVRNFFVGIFSSEFFSSVVSPSSVRRPSFRYYNYSD